MTMRIVHHVVDAPPERPFLFIQIEPVQDGGGIRIEARCEAHLPTGAIIVKNEDARRRKVGSWLKCNDYHPNHYCRPCKEKTA